MFKPLFVCFLSALSLFVSAEPADPFSRKGVLDENSRKMDDGILYQTYQVRFEKGEQVNLDLRSDDFDAFLMVITPDGFFRQDDDSGGGTNARISFLAESEEVHTIVVRAFGAGESGAYLLSRNPRQSVQRLESDGQGPGRAGSSNGTVPGDSGEMQGNAGYRLALVEGESIAVDVRSANFDTYLFIMGPDGSLWLNDDWQGSTEHSRVEFKAPATGDYLILVSEFGGGSGGDFTLEWKVGE